MAVGREGIRLGEGLIKEGRRKRVVGKKKGYRSSRGKEGSGRRMRKRGKRGKDDCR